MDFFDILGVSPADTLEEVRLAYVRLIRLTHPDVAGPGGTAESARLNAAYDVLSDSVKRDAYLNKRKVSRSRRAASAGGAVSRSGLVGPLRDECIVTRLVPRQQSVLVRVGSYFCLRDLVGCDADSLRQVTMEDVRDGVREFLKTFTFTTELPLPVPIQVDDTPAGCRVEFITVDTGVRTAVLRSLGGLHFSFAYTECDSEGSCDWECVVHRRVTSAAGVSRPMPGEARLLSAVLKEFDALLTPGQSAKPFFQIPTVLSFLFAALPVGLDLGGTGTTGQYQQYNLQRACRLDSRPKK